MTQLPKKPITIDLSNLCKGLPAITPAFGTAISEACSVCLADRGHCSGVSLSVEGENEEAFTLLYGEVTNQMKRCWNDREYATEQAAYGIAFLLIQQTTDLTVIERARRGTGFDYWLSKRSNNNGLPFQRAARLEVSGIRQGNRQQVRSRVKIKMAQVEPTDSIAPAYIIVVEFSKPLAWIAKK